jgi:WXG100 family type VII secretion target
MARIRISPEQVRQVAAQFAQSAAQSDEMVNRLANAVQSMQPEWEGMTSQRFYSDFQQWRTQMQQFTELLRGINQQLNQIADRFAAADQQG